MKDVFISYKAEEFDEANWVKSMMETNGVSCWMAPMCIAGGSSYAVEIPKAIREAKIFVLILSEKSQSSKWVSREVDLAINEGKIVLPFMLENCSLKDDFNFYLTNVQRYSAYENKMAAAEKMLKEIKSLLGQDSQEIQVAEPKAGLIEPQKIGVEKENLKVQEKRKYDGACIVSLVSGIIAICFFGVLIIPNIIACVFAVTGAKNIAVKGSKGKGLAVTGLVLGIVSSLLAFSVLFSIIGFLIAVAIGVVSSVLLVKVQKG